MISTEDGQPMQHAFQVRKKRTGISMPGGFANKNLVASYLHIHFAGNPKAARRFVDCCEEFRQVGGGQI
jgi:cobyrinic acid a,c-diamide synthase